MQEHSKEIQELSNFLLDYATTLMAVGSHTSRIVKNVTPHRRVFWLWSGYDHFSAQHHHEPSNIPKTTPSDELTSDGFQQWL